MKASCFQSVKNQGGIITLAAEAARSLAIVTLVPVSAVSAAPLDAPVADVSVGASVADLAGQYVGTPYAWGGTSPRGFDCTGFVLFVYSQFGVALGHNEASQLAAGPRIGSDSLEPGDIVVFANTYRAGLSHTGIYLGNGRFVHAANEYTGVTVSNLWDGYWGPRYVGASRPLA